MQILSTKQQAGIGNVPTYILKALLDAREELKAIRLLSEAVQNKGKINKTTLLQQFSRKFTLRELRDAIGVLVESGEVKIVQEVGGQYLVYNKGA